MDPLETRVEDQQRPKIVRVPFGLDPNSDYNRERFVKSAGDLFDLEEYYGKLRQNTTDVGALDDLTKIVLKYYRGDERGIQMVLDHLKQPELAIEIADNFLSEGYISMARFVEAHRKELLDKLNEKQLVSLLGRVQLYKKGDSKHDRIVELREKLMKLQSASQKGEDPSSVLKSELKDIIKPMPEEQRGFVERNYAVMVSSLVGAIVGKVQKVYENAFKGSDGGLDRSSIITFLENNYEVIEDMVAGEDDSVGERPKGEREEIWDKNLKMQYVEIARELFGPEKKELKMEKDEDKEIRKANDKKLGVAR